jgi:hypothetical protein
MPLHLLLLWEPAALRALHDTAGLRSSSGSLLQQAGGCSHTTAPARACLRPSSPPPPPGLASCSLPRRCAASLQTQLLPTACRSPPAARPAPPQGSLYTIAWRPDCVAVTQLLGHGATIKVRAAGCPAAAAPRRGPRPGPGACLQGVRPCAAGAKWRIQRPASRRPSATTGVPTSTGTVGRRQQAPQHAPPPPLGRL